MIRNINKDHFFSYIWDCDHILRVDENNWQCLLCNETFQGINADKALAHLIGNKGMRIRSCYSSVDILYKNIPKALSFQSYSERCY